MKVRITKENEGHAIGTELEGPDTHWLCQLGIAEPIDDEAKAAYATHLKRVEERRKRIEKLGALAAENAQREEASKEAAKHADFERFLKEGDE